MLRHSDERQKGQPGPERKRPATTDPFQARVLIVEDDEVLAAVLEDALQEMGLLTVTARTGARGLQLARETRPELVLLDLRLPDVSGISVCREILALRGPDVVIVSGIDDAETVETALEMGAQDYIRKPFDLNEFRARVRAVLRRRGSQACAVLRVGRLTIDRDRCVAIVDGREVQLSATEFRLLNFLAEHPRWVFSKERLLEALWPGDRDVHAVQVHVFNLRRKIEPDPAHPSLLVTVKGLGYRLDPFGPPEEVQERLPGSEPQPPDRSTRRSRGPSENDWGPV